MSYLRYMCLFAHSGVQRILCYFFVCLFCLVFFVCFCLRRFVPYVASLSGLLIFFIVPSVFPNIFLLSLRYSLLSLRYSLAFIYCPFGIP
jgi:predicted permease